ncbi:MAG: hypothetical protein ACKVRP_03305 [Bacteroidota bacterium]
MLPDYPIFKNLLEDFLTERMRLVSFEAISPLSEIPQQRLFEGTSGVIVREDGTKDEVEIHPMSEEMSWRFDEIDSLTMHTVIERIDKVALLMARQKAEMAYGEISKSVKKVGNDFDVRGEPFAPKHFFAMLKKIWMSFDEFDNPIYPTIVAGTDAAAGFKKVMAQIDGDAQLKKELSELIETKRIEWRVREADRTLVG